MVPGFIHNDRSHVRAAANATGKVFGEAHFGVVSGPAPKVPAVRCALLAEIFG
jgi:hypothetical protein